MDQPPPQGNSGPPPGPPGGDGMNYGGGGYGAGGGGNMMSSKEQALMWQQGHYMGGGAGGESGFISAATSGPASQSGHGDGDDLLGGGDGSVHGGTGSEMGGGCYTGGPGSITGSSLYDLDSAHRSEVSSVHSSQAAFGLSDPEEFIPRLVTSLCDDDPVVVHESLILVERCVKKENFFNTLIRSLELVGAIVQALVQSTSQMAEAANALANNAGSGGQSGAPPGGGGKDKGDSEQQRFQDQLDQAEKRTKSASNILRAMTNHRGDPRDQRETDNQRVACRNILATGGIAPLTALLGYPIDRIKFNAIATLHSLLLCLDQDERSREAAKAAVRDANGVQMMVALLKRDNNKLLTILTDCLRILAMRHQITKTIILQGGGPHHLVEILKKQSYKNLILMTARLLKVLSVCPQNKQAIIQAGGMEALAKHLRSDQSKITYNCSWTMRNLSDVATGIVDAGPLAVELVNLLRHSEEPVVICAAGILSNLTVNNDRLKLAVCEARGIQELLRVVDAVGHAATTGGPGGKSKHELLEPAVCALRHLTNNHKAADQAQRLFVVELDGLSKIGRFLHPAAHRPSTKAVLGVVRNLAQRPANHASLREKHTVEQVFIALSAALDQLSSGTPSVDGVRLEEIVEASLSVVFHLAKEGGNRGLIRDVAVIRLLKRILSCGPPPGQSQAGENIIRLTAGIANEVASTDFPEGALAIHREPGFEHILKNLASSSRNEKISSYSSSILFNLSNLKSEIEKGNLQPSNPQPNQQGFLNAFGAPASQPNPVQPNQQPSHLPQPPPPQHQPPHGMNPHQGFPPMPPGHAGFDEMMGGDMPMQQGGPPPPGPGMPAGMAGSGDFPPNQMGVGPMGPGGPFAPGQPQQSGGPMEDMSMDQMMSPQPYSAPPQHHGPPQGASNFQGFFDGSMQ